jgi:hypothetical protein
MKLFKSFDEFLNESLVTEAADKFKIKTEKPDVNAGEIAVFKFVLREFDAQASLPQLAAQSALARPEFKKFADDTTLIAFMEINKERDPGFLSPRDLLKGVILFKKAEGFDKTKATPLVKIGTFEIFDAKSATQMKAGDNTQDSIKDAIKDLEKDKDLIVPKPQPNPDMSEYADVEKIQPDADVLAFLKSKLLSGDAVKFSKSNTKISEIKGTQALITNFKRADKKTNTSAANKILKSGVDGIYGGGTADALGLLMKDGKPKDSITLEAVTDLAKWCKLNDLTKAEVEKIFNDNKISTGDGDKKDDDNTVGGPKYYFVNKGWTYSEENDPYKK